MADEQSTDQSTDPTFVEEQEHLSAIYAQLEEIYADLTEEIEVRHKNAAQDLRDLSDEIRIDFGGADETMETLAAIETLNSVIDTYNQQHDFTVEKLGRAIMLLGQPYFAKVRLRMRPGRPPRDVYIGSAGITDKNRMPLIVDWRNPIAETYYNQEMGPTSYVVDGRVRHVELELRRQYDIVRDRLRAYFDTTVAIEDSLLLSALTRHHSEKLQAITATIQREQNEVVRHEDVPALLVSGIAGSGKTSVLLQRIAFLFYRNRETLSPEQVWLFTPNSVFETYIDNVLPTLGEANPNTFTWKNFLASLGLDNRGTGADAGLDSLRALDAAMDGLALTEGDFREVRRGETVLLKVSQVKSAVEKFSQFGVGPRLIALVKDELHDRLSRRIAQMAHGEEAMEETLALDVEQQMELFGEVIAPDSDDDTARYAKKLLESRFADAHDDIENLTWLRLDRIGQRMSGRASLSAAEWLYLKLLISGHGADDARFVMIDEVQDYTTTQLAVLARYFPRAHFLLLGDPNQAIYEGCASFDEMRQIFSASHGSVEECRLTTSYRSSPEITELFASLLPEEERITINSVHRPGVEPTITEVADGEKSVDAYLDAVRSLVAEASREEGLAAVIVADRRRAVWLAKQLGGEVTHVSGNDPMPAEGVVLIDLALAKGLEFDRVIVADAQAAVYDDTPLSRRRLYTAISRAMHRVDIVSQGPLTPLLARD